MEWIRKGNKEIVKEKVVHNVPFLYFEALEKTGLVRHAFSTKKGGVSTGCFESMNLSISKPDKKENVIQNFKNMAMAIGVDINDMVLSYQMHTTNVMVVDESHKGLGLIRERYYDDVDGLITNKKGVCLVTFYADCIPLYFVDTKNKAIGLSHSGWRGSVNYMGKVTLDKMKENYNTNPKDVIACIGPGICKDCYEVSSDLYEEFSKKFSQDELKQIFTAKENNKYQLDLLKTNEIILLKAGVLKENIHISDICTHCNNENLFSHRKMGENRGNACAFLCLEYYKL